MEPIPPPSPPPPSQPPQNNTGDLALSNSQKFGIAVIAGSLYLASRGRIDTTTTHKAVHFGAKSILGLGPVALSQVGGHDLPTPPTALTPTTQAELEKLLAQRTSPSGKYVFIRDQATGQRTRVAVEDLQALIDAGLIRRATDERKPGKPKMMALWNADP